MSRDAIDVIETCVGASACARTMMATIRALEPDRQAVSAVLPRGPKSPFSRMFRQGDRN
jgi:hypothetical protein